MGNRAVITTKEKKIGVYLHWNGGRDSVVPFLAFCKASGFRPPENDCYGWAYLCTVIGCYQGDGLSVGVDVYERLDTDNGDNGVYIIEDWEIVGREYFEGQEQAVYGPLRMLTEINQRVPVHMRMTPMKIKILALKCKEEM